MHEPFWPGLPLHTGQMAAQRHAVQVCGEVHPTIDAAGRQTGYAVEGGREAVGVFWRESDYAVPDYFPMTNVSSDSHREFVLDSAELVEILGPRAGKVMLFHSHIGIEEPSTTDLELLGYLHSYKVRRLMDDEGCRWHWSDYGFVWTLGTDTWWRYWV